MGSEKKNISIACLPISGLENPYQKLMMEGLRSGNRLKIFHGTRGKFLALVTTALKYKVDFIHLDWINRYYQRKRHWMTLISIPIFMVEVLLVRYILRVKIVWTLHNILPHDVKRARTHAFIRRFFANQCEWIRVFAVSTVVNASKVLNIEKSKFKVIPEGSYVGYYENKVRNREAKELLSIKESDRLVFLFLGGIRDYKGLENLINVFKGYSEYDLIIAGKPYSKSYLEKLLSQAKEVLNITIIPTFIPDEELQVYFNACDVVILPFDKIENSGSVILAMGFKKAIVAPDQGVLSTRLNAQMDLLYNNDLSEVLDRLKIYTRSQLISIGELNYQAVENHKWEDFTKEFIK